MKTIAHMNAKEAKASLRRRILAARDDLPLSTRRAASRRIAERVMALPSFAAAQKILLFYPFGSEWDASIVVMEALRLNKIVALPRIAQSEKTLILHIVQDIDRDTMSGVFGIREPLPDLPRLTPEELDWLLAPGLAFSPQGDRLGYGAGYFDRLLTRVSPETPRIAGAFEMQIMPSLPQETHDIRVNMVITENNLDK
ncbi:MAG: 5-formyltetrahydrofolate cyclo-ligase [Burkholderiales bacterium]|jgi:5-formyltetrahydrofolate cyclo-ligase|nr:5-formyltetrahydrofolate cyclo-ligase [Burkholderiales bacterium]